MSLCLKTATSRYSEVSGVCKNSGAAWSEISVRDLLLKEVDASSEKQRCKLTTVQKFLDVDLLIHKRGCSVSEVAESAC